MAKTRSGSRRRSKGKPEAFDNVKGQLAYCGLWCGSCLVGNGTVNELSRKCAKAITDYGLPEWGPKGVDYDAMLRGLSTISTMKPCPGCLKGGGRTNCEIRACAISKGLAECVDCETQKACKNKKIIHIMRSGALRVGMKVKDEKRGRSKVLKDWIAEIEGASL